MTAPPVRAAVVGAGLMGRWHADAIARTGSVVASVVDARLDVAQALAARHPGARAFTALEEVPRGTVDAVHVCAPLGAHEALATYALDAGWHVLMEKPLARSALVTAQLLARAAARGLVLCPVHQCLFQPGVLRAQGRLAVIGPLRHVGAVVCTAGADGRSDAARDAALTEVLPHPLSLLARFLPVPLDTLTWHTAHPRAGEFRALTTAGEVSASLLVSTHARPTRHALDLWGERGTAHVDLFHGFAVFEAGTVSRARKIAQPFVAAAALAAGATANLARRAARREPAYPGLRELVGRFHDAVRGSGDPPIAPREALAVAEACDTLEAALRLGPLGPPGAVLDRPAAVVTR